MGGDVFDSSHKTYIYPVTDVVRCSLKMNSISLDTQKTKDDIII